MRMPIVLSPSPSLYMDTAETSESDAVDVWNGSITPPASRPARALALVKPSRAPRWQFLRFGMVGLLNTAIDILALNLLLTLFAVRSLPGVLLANAVAYALGAVNSFFLNKRWTFGQRQPITLGEVGRFALTTCAGIALNDALLAALGWALLPLLGPTVLWANLVKLGAIGGTVCVSYLGMGFWVFARRSLAPDSVTTTALVSSLPARSAGLSTGEAGDEDAEARAVLARHSISVVLPAYNEEGAILTTLVETTTALRAWGAEYEVIVVDDGSADRTGSRVAAYAGADPRVRLVRHPRNRGYGAALASGFAAATHELTFFMDSDGQFSIADLARLLPAIERYDAVLGYRIARQDAWLRLVNAWGWKVAVALALGVRVRDLDCAFKLFRTAWLHVYPPTTASALVNAQLVDSLNRSGATYREVGVRHLSRRSGRATGASPRVILRALRDLARYAWLQRTQSHRPVVVPTSSDKE